MSIKIQPHKGDLLMLNREMNRLAEQTGQTVKEVLIPQARLFAADLAFWTRPKGKGKTDNKENMKLVIIRVRTIYPHPGKIVNELKAKGQEGIAGRFASLIDEGKYKKAEDLIRPYIANITVGAFDKGALHKNQKFTKNVRYRRCVKTRKSVEAYAKRKAKTVGFAKGGFATAARQLGGVRGIPGFATRQKAPGKGSVTGDGKTMSVTIENHVKYLKEAFVQGGEDYAKTYRKRQVTKQLKRIQDRKIKKAMRNFR